MENVICNKCGLINDYRIEIKANNHTAWCNGCGSYIKNIGYSKPALFFGKYAGREIESMTTKDELQYLQWLIRNAKNLSEKIRIAITSHLMRYNYGI